MKANLQMNMSSGTFLSVSPSVLVNGGFNSCQSTRLISNFGKVRVVRGLSISKVLKQFLIITLSAMCGLVCIKTERMAALCTLMVAG